MTAATMTLADFLLARIEADEDAARGVNIGLFNSRVALLPPDLYGLIIRQHPARVLAECEAKRRIVDEHQQTRRDPAYEYFGDAPCITCGQMRPRKFPCATIRALASVYSDHPDYRDEWRP